MENVPVTVISAARVKPERAERYYKWITEVYWPSAVKNPWVKEIDRYQIVKERPEYVRNVSIFHYENRTATHNYVLSPEFQALVKDFRDNITEVIWLGGYELLKKFRWDSQTTAEQKKPDIENGPIMHLEGFWLSADEEERYSNWFARVGYQVYVPLLMKLPGIKEYDYYRLIPRDSAIPEWYKTTDPDAHPLYLSVIYFEDIKAFEDYDKSLELASFRAGVNTLFPRGLDYKWYVQYQLMKSWRK